MESMNWPIGLVRPKRKSSATPPTIGGRTSGTAIKARNSWATRVELRAINTASGTPSSTHSTVAATPVRKLSHSAASASSLVASATSVDQLAREISASSGSTSSATPSNAGAMAKPGTRTPVSLAISLRGPGTKAVLLQNLLAALAAREIHEGLRGRIFTQCCDRVGVHNVFCPIGHDRRNVPVIEYVGGVDQPGI